MSAGPDHHRGDGGRGGEALAVFDLGKTNSKLVVFGPGGEIRAQARTGPAWRLQDGMSVLDDAALGNWMDEALAEAVVRHGAGGVMVSGHGCTFALVGGGRLLHPVLDYEQDPPAALAPAIDAEVPPFDETYSPALPLGLNAGRHLLWLERTAPSLFASAEAILGYPQFWAWRMGARPVSEVSYLGCHTHLWNPRSRDFSSLVDRHGWRRLMPPLAAAGAVIGTRAVALPGGGRREIAIHNGVHDSNAALHVYRAGGYDRFTVVSTGTWVIVMNPDCPLEALDPRRDMLANVAVDGRSIATARFMGGREYDVISGGHTGPIGHEALGSAVAAGAMALPAFAPGGPFPGSEGRILGETGDPEVRAAVALLYVALMTDLLLDLARADGSVIVDGGLARFPAYAGLLAALRPGQEVLAGTQANGSAAGAAILAFAALGRPPFAEPCRRVAPLGLPGLDAYRARWRALADEGWGRAGHDGSGRTAP